MKYRIDRHNHDIVIVFSHYINDKNYELLYMYASMSGDNIYHLFVNTKSLISFKNKSPYQHDLKKTKQPAFQITLSVSHTMSKMAGKQIEWPFLDFSIYAPGAPQPSDEQLKKLGEQIMEKFQKFGFVLLRNTGIPQHTGVW